MAQHAGRADHCRRPLRLLAGRLWLRVFLRLPGGRSLAVRTEPGAEYHLVLPPRTPEQGYHLTEDLADDAIGWLRKHKAFEPDKPFFMYWASGAIHGPHHIMKEWADKYKGKFDDGWDDYRERVFERAKEMGWIPADARLTPRPESLASWDSIPEDEKPFQRRLMEVAAGYAEHADHHVGRLVDEVDRLGYGDNTLIFYIWGDNGSSSEGQNGTISELLAQNGIPTTIPMHLKALDQLGGLDVLGSPKTDNQYHAGWAWAGSTPYKGTKLLASHFGGTRNPMAVRWPAKIKPDPTPRSQFHHVNDLVPTIYEVVGITPPRVVNGIPQDPIDGMSFAYTFSDAKAKGRKLTQYFEIMGSRAIYHDGWMASAFGPRARGSPGPARHPRVDAGQRQVGTLQPRRRLDPGQRPRRQDAGEGRPDEGDVCHRGRAGTTCSPSAAVSGSRCSTPSYESRTPYKRVDFLRRHHPDAGVLCAGPRQHGPTSSPSMPTSRPTRTACCTPSALSRGGLTCYVKDGILCYEYNLFLIQRTKIRARGKLPAGKVKIEVETAYAVLKPAGPLNVTMKVNGKVVAEGRVPVSAPLLFTANDCLDIGTDLGSPVSLDYFDHAPFKFNGKIEEVHVIYTK